MLFWFLLLLLKLFLHEVLSMTTAVTVSKEQYAPVYVAYFIKCKQIKVVAVSVAAAAAFKASFKQVNCWEAGGGCKLLHKEQHIINWLTHLWF